MHDGVVSAGTIQLSDARRLIRLATAMRRDPQTRRLLLAIVREGILEPAPLERPGTGAAAESARDAGDGPVQIDMGHHSGRRPRPDDELLHAAIHEGGHQARARTGGRADPRRMSLDEFIRASALEEATVEAQAIEAMIRRRQRIGAALADARRRDRAALRPGARRGHGQPAPRGSRDPGGRTYPHRPQRRHPRSRPVVAQPGGQRPRADVPRHVGVHVAAGASAALSVDQSWSTA